MEVSSSNANAWIFEEKDPDKWAFRPIAYLHFKCGRYFSVLGEEHQCYHWTKEFARTQKEWNKEAGKWIKMGKEKEKRRSRTSK